MSMIRSLHNLTWGHTKARPIQQASRKGRVLWTLGNLLMVAGLYLLLYVGGLYAEAEHNRLAARGDSDLPAPPAVSLPANDTPAIFTVPLPADLDTAEPEAFAAPILNSDAQVVNDSHKAVQQTHGSLVNRIVIPSIGVDSKVVEVGWELVQQKNQKVAIWQVAEYAVGQHKGSANPGEEGNIVLAGHVGGYGKVFRDLYYVKQGDEITLYSDGQQYLYVVQERLVVLEEGVSPEQHAANAHYIEPTDHETVTLITCWPTKGKNRFTERVIVRAIPYGAQQNDASGITTKDAGPGAWTLR